MSKHYEAGWVDSCAWTVGLYTGCPRPHPHPHPHRRRHHLDYSYWNVTDAGQIGNVNEFRRH